MKTIDEAKEELVEGLTKGLSGMGPENREVIQNIIRLAFDYGAVEAQIRAKVLLEALADFQKSIYQTIGGIKCENQNKPTK